MKTYIALDLETTGFDPISDQVIEIAAVKFQDNKIIDNLDTLINPQVPVPPMVTHITGIKEEDLTGAPLFDDVKKRLTAFLGSDPIVGHNIGFDVSFLRSKGLAITNPLFDTLQLGTILLPGLASYSLDTLTRVLKIRHEKAHRAMSDATACMELFSMLEEKIREIDQNIYEEILKILGKSTWPEKELFIRHKTARQIRSKKMLIKPRLEKGKPANESDTSRESKTGTQPQNEVLPEDMISSFFDQNGALSKVIKDYEPRPMQNRMTAKILESFKSSNHLLVEAGTGTGKTLAYLLASLAWSLNQNKKVVISTYTHNLQGQIINKDLPILEKAIRQLNPGLDFKTAVLKGRRNYLSYRRLEIFLDRDFFLDHEVTLLIKILLWLKKNQTGDLEELSLQGKEYSVLDEICCAEHVCPHDDSDFSEGCFLLKARKNAEKANIVVINHALMLQDAIAESPLLPENSFLIIDEAHHLDKVATDSLTISISFNHFIRPFEKLVKIFEEMGQAKAASPRLHEIRTLKQKINELVSRIDIFFGLLGIFMEKSLEPSQFQYQLNLKPYHLDSAEWLKVKQSAQSIAESGKDFLENLTTFHSGIHDSVERNFKEIKGYIFECEKRLTDLVQCMSPETSGNAVSWIFKGHEGSISLKSAPASIGKKINEIIFNKKNSVILTSATLQTDHSFAFIREQLSLDERFDELALPSHFAYPDQVKILIPHDLPEPATEGYFKSCAWLIADIIRKNKGRTLVLFTSKKALSATYHEIAAQMKTEGFIILAQNITGGRGKILEHFKDEAENCAIFGTASFWEGVDIKGKDLTCVVMQKLPFDPPEDPIILARSQKYMDSFAQFQLPRAILKFKQGFGRLIRSSRDTGSIVILDSRIIQKSYGRQFLESLPAGIKIEYAPQEKLAELL